MFSLISFNLLIISLMLENNGNFEQILSIGCKTKVTKLIIAINDPTLIYSCNIAK